jgi:hypothetical protein
MNRFTKKQRHLIYVKALKYYNIGGWPFLCICISKAIEDLYSELILSANVHIFLPEFARHKPEGKSGYGRWWNINNSKTRIDVMNQIIEETK